MALVKNFRPFALNLNQATILQKALWKYRQILNMINEYEDAKTPRTNIKTKKPENFFKTDNKDACPAKMEKRNTKMAAKLIVFKPKDLVRVLPKKRTFGEEIIDGQQCATICLCDSENVSFFIVAKDYHILEQKLGTGICNKCRINQNKVFNGENSDPVTKETSWESNLDDLKIGCYRKKFYLPIVCVERKPINVDYCRTLKNRFLFFVFVNKVVGDMILKPLKLNRYVLKCLPESDKIKSLSGKQIAYRRLGIKQDESKLNKLIKGTKVVAKNFCWPFTKKNRSDGDKPSRL